MQKHMKALQSPLARDVLADPRASEQLRTFLVTPAASATTRVAAPGSVIELRSAGRNLRFKPVLVPKAT
jgi:hypothetical protein